MQSGVETTPNEVSHVMTNNKTTLKGLGKQRTDLNNFKKWNLNKMFGKVQDNNNNTQM